jgi:hypothetical protein
VIKLRRSAAGVHVPFGLAEGCHPLKFVRPRWGLVPRKFFSYPLIRAVAEMEDAALQAALERLAEADLLVQGLPPESEYGFKHALIQDAAYENLLRSRRQVLHRHVGEVLRDQFTSSFSLR